MSCGPKLLLGSNQLHIPLVLMHRLPLKLLLGVLLLGGCSARSELAPVQGRVTLDDKPVPNMIVNFTPLGETAGNGALAYTDAEGHFTLLDARGESGAYVGEYKVSFYPGANRAQPIDPRLDVVSAPSRGLLPAIYLDPNQTPLRATVPQGGGTIELVLTKSGVGASAKTIPAAKGGTL